MKGSGIANTCPTLDNGSSNIKDLKAGTYSLGKFCMEPTSFTVKEESQFKGGSADFVPTKLMTRLTYTLDEASARLPGACGGWRTWGLAAAEQCCLAGPGCPADVWLLQG